MSAMKIHKAVHVMRERIRNLRDGPERGRSGEESGGREKRGEVREMEERGRGAEELGGVGEKVTNI